jgi:hypothetical protein
MSQKLTRLLISAVMFAAFCSASFAQNCKYSGTPEWNESVRSVVADCAVEFPSPDKHLRLKFASDSTMSVEGKTIHLRGPNIEPPAMVSWSPRSDAFFVNDGEGSGMASTFRLFRIKGAEIYEDHAIEKVAVSLYRRRTRCSPSAVDPNVYGFGWGDAGSKLYLLVQATVHEPCGPPYEFISLVIRTSDGRILETLSEKQTKVRFSSLLPSSLFGK